MNTGLESEAEQFDWLASQLAGTSGKPVALFLHKPLFLNTPDDPELEASAIRYVPQPARRRLVEMFAAVDLRLVASGHVHQRRDFTYRHVRHVWAPSAGFIISDQMQEVIGIKECRAGGIPLCSRTALKSVTSGRPARSTSGSTSCSARSRRTRRGLIGASPNAD